MLLNPGTLILDDIFSHFKQEPRLLILLINYFRPYKHKDARFFENNLNPAMWYSLDSSRWVLSDEYPYARVSVIF